MQDMLHIARDNIKTTQDRACFYADHNREPRVFNSGLKVFLRVPHNSKTCIQPWTETLVTCDELSSKPHVLERTLDVKTKKLRTKVIREFKIKWMDKSIKDATWEREQT